MKRQASSIRAFGGKHWLVGLPMGALASQASGSGEPVLVGGLTVAPLDGDDEVEVLLELWSLGLMSAILVQTTAQAACQVAPRPAMEALARIGTSGDFSANARGDLRRKLNLGNLDPPTSIADWNTLAGCQTERRTQDHGDRGASLSCHVAARVPTHSFSDHSPCQSSGGTFLTTILKTWSTQPSTSNRRTSWCP